MKELNRIVEAYRQTDFSEQKAALATVVKVQGSSYRRAGARMYITDDGRWVGAISGGCLEGDALRKARQAILQGTSSVVTYDTLQDDSATSLGVGLGCNGIIDVLIEPVDYLREQIDLFSIFEVFLHTRKPALIATIFNIEESMTYGIGQRLVIDSGGKVSHTIEDTDLAEKIQSDAYKALQNGKSAPRLYQTEKGQVEVALEILHPSIELVIFGGGFDVAPVVTLAKTLGWHVTVTDDCIAHTGAKRFPGADQVWHAARETVVSQMNITPYSAAVLMSHNYKYDLAILPALLASSVPYIGILGPRKRTQKMLDELSQNGKTVSEREERRIHSPIGLDIGAETPEEIALAIVAEIQARHQQRKGGLLKDRPGFIHER